VALQYLTHPCLIPTFPDEILEVLVGHAKKNDLSLPLAYYQTIQPALTNPQALESLFSAMARTSVTEAFYFCRGQPEHARRHMFEMLIALVLNNSSSDTIADRSAELVNLPFIQEEEGWFEEYLEYGEGRSIKKSKDTLMMRRIGTGKFSESLSIRHMNSRAMGGLDWETLSEALKDGMGPRLSI
jgi:Nuclear pore complex assembly